MLSAAKKVFISTLLNSKVDERGRIILPYGVPVVRVRILGSVVSKTVGPGRRYTKFTLDDGSGSIICVDYDIKREPSYAYGQVYDIIASLKYDVASGLYGIVELVISIPSEQVSTVRELRSKEILQIETLLKREVGGETGG